MKGFRDLVIFEEARRLAVEVHALTMSLPTFERVEEGSQLRRCSKAVAALIVEGYGRRRYKKEFIKYLIFSHAECDEVLVHLDFVFSTASLKNEALFAGLTERYISLSKKIYRYIQWVDRHFEVTPHE